MLQRVRVAIVEDEIMQSLNMEVSSNLYLTSALSPIFSTQADLESELLSLDKEKNHKTGSQS